MPRNKTESNSKKAEIKIKCLKNYFRDPNENWKKLFMTAPESLNKIWVISKNQSKTSEQYDLFASPTLSLIPIKKETTLLKMYIQI